MLQYFTEPSRAYTDLCITVLQTPQKAEEQIKKDRPDLKVCSMDSFCLQHFSWPIFNSLFFESVFSSANLVLVGVPVALSDLISDFNKSWQM